MELDEFYIKLREHAEAHPGTWSVMRGCGYMERGRRLIRCDLDGTASDNPDHLGIHCPISAVIGDQRSFGNPIGDARTKLNMSEDNAAAIISASDDDNFARAFDNSVRHNILEAVGIT